MKLRNALLALLLVGGAACGGGMKVAGSTTAGSPGGVSTPSAPSTTSITIKDFMFGPSTVTVKAGTPIVFTNRDNQPHTATSDTAGVFDAGSIAAGAPSIALTIATAGTYTYHCSFHPFMKATIVVS